MPFSRLSLGVLLAIAACRLAMAQSPAMDAASTVRAYYDALAAGDFSRAMGFVAGPGQGAAAADRLRQLVSSKALFGPSVEAFESTPVSRCEANLKNVAVACEMYSTDNVGRYPRVLTALVPTYLKSIPSCPAAGRDTYSGSYRSSANPDAYSVFCAGTSHAAEGLSADHPQYNAWDGLVTGPLASPSPAPAADASVWHVEEAKIGDVQQDGDQARVTVEETYSVYGFDTRVGVTLPLVRQASVWRVDASALPRAPALRADSEEAGRVVAWMKSNGVGVTAAAVYREAR